MGRILEQAQRLEPVSEDHGFRIGLWLGKSPVSRIIQWHTRSIYSHAGFLTRDHQVIEAVATGMRIRPLNDDPKRLHWFDIPDLSISGWETAEAWLRKQVRIGTPYNYSGLFAFVLRHRALAHNMLFCSQSIFAAVKLGGVELLARCSEDLVAPALLAYSPLMIYRPLPAP